MVGATPPESDAVASAAIPPPTLPFCKPGKKHLRRGDIVTAVNQETIAGTGEFEAQAKASPKRLLLNLVRDGQALFLVMQ